MTKPSFWNSERVRQLKLMWGNGAKLAIIAETIGCSSPAVEHKARALRLGMHPLAAAKGQGSGGLDAGSRGALASSLKSREEEEGRVVKLPRLKFLSHKLQGEGTSW